MTQNENWNKCYTSNSRKNLTVKESLYFPPKESAYGVSYVLGTHRNQTGTDYLCSKLLRRIGHRNLTLHENKEYFLPEAKQIIKIEIGKCLDQQRNEYRTAMQCLTPSTAMAAVKQGQIGVVKVYQV